MTDFENQQILDKAFDITKTKIFMGKNSSFLGVLMCSLTFYWNKQEPTASTNGISLTWNPDFFLSLDAETRITVLAHELWHVARLHSLRRGERNPLIWNYAADFEINNDLKRDGYYMDGFPYLIDARFIGMSAEEIYDILIKEEYENLEKFMSDLKDMDPAQQHTVINTVMQSQMTANMGGWGNTMEGQKLESLLQGFLAPKLPWKTILYNWFNDMAEMDWSLRVPNRRYLAHDMYLPSLCEESEGRLQEVWYFLDVSGSVSDPQVLRFNSEIKFIKEEFKPKKLKLLLFDDLINAEYDYGEEDPFDKIVVVGRGGTDLRPVRERIIEGKPTAVVIFSDLLVHPMEPLPSDMNTPIIWVAINNTSVKVNTGKLIHIRE